MSVPARSQRVLIAIAATILSMIGRGRAQSPQSVLDALHKPFDEILEVYVRDGFVYYRALRLERAKLDLYVAALAQAGRDGGIEGWAREQQAAFWLNAYNAFVLVTIADHYPIRGRASQYPANSVRQIPGAFERLSHRAAGRAVTLDQIEKEILPAFRDPRMYLALGRGAVGGGRLRSEAFTGARLESQLTDVAAEFTTRSECLRIDRGDEVVSVSPVVSWHGDEFIAAYAGGPSRYADRTPIERAILAFIEPNLLPAEVSALQRNAFRIQYHDFDWRLNDLTGGRP